MPTEISQAVTLAQQPNPGEETLNGRAKLHANTAEAETRQPESTVQITEQAKTMQALHDEISELPVVDPKRVEAARQKIADGTFAMLGDLEARQKSAERIASRLLELEAGMMGKE